jgi:hypothetical protein
MVTLETVTVIRAPMERCFDLTRSVEVHVAGNIHWGEQAVAAGGVTSGLIGISEFRFAAPLPPLGRLAEITFLRGYMLALLQERNAAIKDIAESAEWRRYLP